MSENMVNLVENIRKIVENTGKLVENTRKSLSEILQVQTMCLTLCLTLRICASCTSKWGTKVRHTNSKNNQNRKRTGY